jgi:hypothetical protein
MSFDGQTSIILAKQSKRFFKWKSLNSSSLTYIQSHVLNIKASDGLIYQISTAHGIEENCKKIFQLSNIDNIKKIRKLSILKKAVFADLVLLKNVSNIEIENEITDKRYNNISLLKNDDIKIINHRRVLKTIPKINTNLYLPYMNISNSKRNSTINLKITGTIFDNIDNSKYLPKIPYIECELLEDFDVNNLHGISGAPIFNEKDRVIGILSNYDETEKKIRIIPGLLIHKLLEKYILNAADYIPCLTLSYLKSYNGLVINKSYKKFEKNDIITKINHRNVDKNGMIYLPELKSKVPIETYILLTFSYKDALSINIKRITNKSFTNILIRKQLKSINNYLIISNKYNSNYININGFIFCELTIPILKWYFNKNIILDGKGINKLDYNNITFKNEKEVVLIDYIKKKNKLINSIIPSNRDYKDYKNENLFSVYKINNKKIINLKNFKDLLQKEKLKKILLIDKNNKIFQIKNLKYF